MATTTTDVAIRPEDGWVLVATAPLYCLIKPNSFSPWYVAIAAATPAATFQGLSFGKDTSVQRANFELPVATLENVYIRVKEPLGREPATQKAGFGVIVKV